MTHSVCIPITGFRTIVFNSSGILGFTEGSITATVIAIGGGSDASYRPEGTSDQGGSGRVVIRFEDPTCPV